MAKGVRKNSDEEVLSEDTTSGHTALKAVKGFTDEQKELRTALKHLLGRVKYMIFMDSQLEKKSLPIPAWSLNASGVIVSRADADGDVTMKIRKKEVLYNPAEIADTFTQDALAELER